MKRRYPQILTIKNTPTSILKLLLTTVICVNLGLQLNAQNITITGRVIDADTKEGLPFSNVYFSGTTSGTATDLDGNFSLSVEPPSDSLTVTVLGYQARTKFVRPGVDQEIVFYMEATGLSLDEIVVIAGENPANILMRKLIKKKDTLNLSKSVKDYSYERYAKVEIDLEDISEELQGNKWLKPFDFVWDNIDSTSDEKPFLPFYINESLSEFYSVQNENKPTEKIIAERTSGVDNYSLVDYVKKLHQPFNMYDNWINVVEKPFAGPFSDQGLAYYEYYIVDSAFIGEKWCKKLKFKPRRRQENTFFGNFWVDDESLAIVRVNMRMSPDVNINFVSRVIVYQEYTLDEEVDKWTLLKNKMVVDFNLDKDGMGIIGRKTETFDKYRWDKTDLTFESEKSRIRIGDTKIEDEAYWQSVRHEPLNETESQIYAMVDSIKNVPIYKTYIQVFETIFTGYFGDGKVQIGTPYALYSQNQLEGHRFRIGLRTTAKLNTNFQLKGSLAYGTKDQQFKYNLQGKVILKRDPYVSIGGQHLYDISLNSENSEAFQPSTLFSGSFRRPIIQKLIRTKETRLFFERYWDHGLSNRFTVLHRTLIPVNDREFSGGGFNYAYLDNPNDNSVIDSSITTTELILKARYAVGEEFIEATFLRLSTGTKKPIIEFQYTLGLKSPIGGDYEYHKLQLRYKHWFNINPIGWTSYQINGGTTLGQAPFLLLDVHPGNESYFMTNLRFNTMNRYEFVSDTYAALMVEHHFDGLIFNKIPFIRKLQFRAVATFKGVIGQMSQRNRNANALNLFDGKDEDAYSGFTVPDRQPFMEAGIGIENIFKFVRVDALWRLNYLDNDEAQRFSVAVGVEFHF